MDSRINGVSFSVNLGFGDGRGPTVTGVSVTPTTTATTSTPDATDWLVPADGNKAAVTLGLSALGTMATGMLMRSLQPGKAVVTAKDLLLDGLVGVQLGAGLVGGPRAESFAGGFSSLPLQWLNHHRDPDWDFRVGMLTQGALTVARDELGGKPVPFQGWKVDAQGIWSEAVPIELLGNAATEIGFDALCYGCGNALAGLLQGKQAEELGSLALLGGAYGAGTALLTNILFGAPVRIDDATMQEAVAMAGENGGPDVADVVSTTTFRTGGLLLETKLMAGITLPRNVVAVPELLNEPELIAHELIHRDQVAGASRLVGAGSVREGHGMLSFYAQYLLWSAQYGYFDVPYEREAYHYADGYLRTYGMYDGERIMGDAIGFGVNQLLFGIGSAAWLPAAGEDQAAAPELDLAPSAPAEEEPAEVVS